MHRFGSRYSEPTNGDADLSRLEAGGGGPEKKKAVSSRATNKSTVSSAGSKPPTPGGSKSRVGTTSKGAGGNSVQKKKSQAVSSPVTNTSPTSGGSKVTTPATSKSRERKSSTNVRGRKSLEPRKARSRKSTAKTGANAAEPDDESDRSVKKMRFTSEPTYEGPGFEFALPCRDKDMVHRWLPFSFTFKKAAMLISVSNIVLPIVFCILSGVSRFGYFYATIFGLLPGICGIITTLQKKNMLARITVVLLLMDVFVYAICLICGFSYIGHIRHQHAGATIMWAIQFAMAAVSVPTLLLGAYVYWRYILTYFIHELQEEIVRLHKKKWARFAAAEMTARDPRDDPVEKTARDPDDKSSHRSGKSGKYRSPTLKHPSRSDRTQRSRSEKSKSKSRSDKKTDKTPKSKSEKTVATMAATAAGSRPG